MSFYDRIKIMVDLHTHSKVSDGHFSPDRLIREAKKCGLSAIALTDHDTINGLESAEKEANAVGIKFIYGVEISISWTGNPGFGYGGEMHLLGLGIRQPSSAFIKAISLLSSRREVRNREILSRMNELKIDVKWEDVLAVSGGHSVGRPHFADLLVEKKIVKNRAQAFSKYLGIGKPLFVPKEGMDFAEACSLIRESCGIPVLAHPESLFIGRSRLPRLIMDLKDMGLAGIEAWHPMIKANSCRFWEKLSRSLNLYVTEGSDFHAPSKGQGLGFSNPDRKINSAVLESIPELN